MWHDKEVVVGENEALSQPTHPADRQLGGLAAGHMERLFDATLEAQLIKQLRLIPEEGTRMTKHEPSRRWAFGNDVQLANTLNTCKGSHRIAQFAVVSETLDSYLGVVGKGQRVGPSKDNVALHGCVTEEYLVNVHPPQSRSAPRPNVVRVHATHSYARRHGGGRQKRRWFKSTPHASCVLKFKSSRWIFLLTQSRRKGPCGVHVLLMHFCFWTVLTSLAAVNARRVITEALLHDAMAPCEPFAPDDDQRPHMLVTGGAGFVGSHLLERLRHEYPGGRIRIVDNLWRGSLSNLLRDDGRPLIDFRRDVCYGDLTMAAVAMETLAHTDIVFHLADIVAGIDFVFGHQYFVYEQNMLINTNVIKAARFHRVRDFVYTGTACSFPQELQSNYETTRIPENMTYPAHPESSYGWSKLMGEYELELASQPPTSMNVGIVRFHNLYGPGMLYGPRGSQALPSLVRKAVRYPAEGFTVWGSGQQYRDFLYITDAIEALLATLRHGMNQGVVQVGKGEPTTLRTHAYTHSCIHTHAYTHMHMRTCR